MNDKKLKRGELTAKQRLAVSRSALLEASKKSIWQSISASLAEKVLSSLTRELVAAIDPASKK